MWTLSRHRLRCSLSSSGATSSSRRSWIAYSAQPSTRLSGGLPFEAFPVFSECKHRRRLDWNREESCIHCFTLPCPVGLAASLSAAKSGDTGSIRFTIGSFALKRRERGKRGVCNILVACQCTGSDLAPARPAWNDQFKLDRRNSKQSDHGRFLRVSLYAVVVRGAGDAVHEAPRGYRNGIVRIERRAAIHPPCARQNQREPVGGIRSV